MASPIPDEEEEEEEEEGGEEEEEEQEESMVKLGECDGSPKRRPKKRDGSSLRKAPQAPKRFKSSYICFFMAKQPEIKDALGEKATVTEISKRSAEMWRSLSEEDRAYWEDVAAKDKHRYMVEKATYTGPWQVPWKRAKKDPSAPKRPMSAFLYYSQEKRREIKETYPEMKNTEVSRMLGEMWRNAPEEDRRPHIEKEKEEREKYKVEIATWRKEFEAKAESQRQSQPEQNQYMAAPFGGDQPNGSMYPVSPAVMSYAPNVATAPIPPVPHPPFMGYGYPGYYPYSASPYGYRPPTSRQHVILGPNGRPHYTAPYTTVPPPIAPPPTASDSQGQKIFATLQQQESSEPQQPQGAQHVLPEESSQFQQVHNDQGIDSPTQYDYNSDQFEQKHLI